MAVFGRDLLERFGPILFAVAGIIVTIFLADNAWSSLNYDVDIQKVVTILGSLLVIALFLERALAVINDLLFDKQAAADDVNEAADRLNYHTAIALSGHKSVEADASMNVTRARELLDVAVEKAEELDQNRQRLRLGVGFLIAVLIAGVGVRSLGELVEVPQIVRQSSAATTPTAMERRIPVVAGGEDRGPRRQLFDWLDILLTAGLLAGGSNGIARLIEAISARKPGQTGRDVPTTSRPNSFLPYDFGSVRTAPLVSINTPSVTVNSDQPTS